MASLVRGRRGTEGGGWAAVAGAGPAASAAAPVRAVARKERRGSFMGECASIDPFRCGGRRISQGAAMGGRRWGQQRSFRQA